MWLLFMVQKHKMIISPGFFFIFPKCWFSGLFGGYKSKKWSKMTKNVPFTLYLSGILYHMSYHIIYHIIIYHHLWYTSVKWWYLPVFFSFFRNFDFSGCSGGEKAKDGLKSQKILCIAFHISGIIHHVIITCGTQM